MSVKVCGYREYYTYTEKERDRIDKCPNYNAGVTAVYVVEYGSSYDSDPWVTEAVFAHKKSAMDYVDTRVQREGTSRSLLHITKWEVQK